MSTRQRCLTHTPAQSWIWTRSGNLWMHSSRPTVNGFPASCVDADRPKRARGFKKSRIQEVRSTRRARRVKILEETGAQRVHAAVSALRGGASEVEAVLTLVRGVRAL